MSRAQAKVRFLEATISLMSEKAITDISIQEISETAGLNHGYVFRYFGTRLDLFFEVSEELARRAREAVAADAERQSQATGVPVPFDQSLINVAKKFTNQRMRVIQYLLSCGVDGKKFGPTSRAIQQQFADLLQSTGLSPRMAFAQAVRATALIFAEDFLADAFGLTPEDVRDGTLLSFYEIQQAGEAQKHLGWEA